MLVLLQTSPFQSSIGGIRSFIKGVASPLQYASNIISFVAVILFTVLSIKLILINLKD
ncbi:hypothetical protein R0131_04360 [Clostridium sp. AL.422]|uniref:hypothetical protein n=1 Tax=Clostridium TaxID=1485 RepID=UPI00293DE776|nr:MULTISPECIES: hypothetical protein [unclassified Clostridium]MDV4150064.1 hypothetical protein [Clostridium sp. AL.422]